MSCAVFSETGCSTSNPANDIDASARAAALSGVTRRVHWSATIPVLPSQGVLSMQTFDRECRKLRHFQVSPASPFVPFPVGTAYVVAWPVDRFVNFSFSID